MNSIKRIHNGKVQWLALLNEDLTYGLPSNVLDLKMFQWGWQSKSPYQFNDFRQAYRFARRYGGEVIISDGIEIRYKSFQPILQKEDP